MDDVLAGLRSLIYVSSVRLVGSYTKGKRKPKDIDVVVRLKINNATLWKARRKIKGEMSRIFRESSSSIPFDVFLVTSDKKKWRLRPWEDISTKRRTYEWE